MAFTARLLSNATGLAEASVVAPLVDQLGVAAGQNGCSVPIYTFMPNHMHILLLGRTATSDAKAAMDRFKTRSGRWFFRYRPDLHWQENYYDHIVERDEDPRFQVAYVANNPVRAKLVEMWSEWPFTGSIGHDLQEILGIR